VCVVRVCAVCLDQPHKSVRTNLAPPASHAHALYAYTHPDPPPPQVGRHAQVGAQGGGAHHEEREGGGVGGGVYDGLGCMAAVKGSTHTHAGINACKQPDRPTISPPPIPCRNRQLRNPGPRVGRRREHLGHGALHPGAAAGRHLGPHDPVAI
jgi:hypothetical protein